MIVELLDEIEDELYFNGNYTNENAVKLIMELDIPIENKKQMINALFINKLS
jgi:hypothetical protein